ERTGSLVLPPLNFGYSETWAKYPGTISLRARTFLSAVEDICVSLVRGGFKKIFILNGHGRNPHLAKAAADLVMEEHGKEGVEVAVATYWDLTDKSFDEIGLNWKDGSHANEFETSLMLALRPGLVKFDLVKDWGERYKYREISARMDGGIIVREFPDPAREVGIWGDPSKASVEKGKAYFEALVEKVSDFVRKFKRGDYPDSKGG
ncbi:MAG: creatininase family protein, partial [Nitrospinota bacterium]